MNNQVMLYIAVITGVGVWWLAAPQSVIRIFSWQRRALKPRLWLVRAFGLAYVVMSLYFLWEVSH